MDGAGGDLCHHRADDGGSSLSSSLERRSCNLPMVSAMYRPQGWADLPDGLLHSIIPMLFSFPDILAFAATCPSWCAAFASYPSKSSFSSLLPPLLLQPDVPLCSPRPCPYSSNLVPRRPCYVSNLASPNMYMCCQIPLFRDFAKRNVLLMSHLDNFRFIGASYGHLILSNKQSCLLVDVFTCVSVSPPQLPVDEDTQVTHGTLTTSLASPNSHLIVTTISDNFFWRVGSQSWLGCSPSHGLIKQAVVFKGQVLGMGSHSDSVLYIVHLVPHIRIQNMLVGWGESFLTRTLHFSRTVLVACGGVLLMLGCPQLFPSTKDTFEVFRLDDSSTEHAKWVKLEKLENCAIFISVDRRSQAFCCMDPERWGGRSNCIYCYDSKEWIAYELGKLLKRGASIPRFNCDDDTMQPMWVVPSMFYACR